MDRGVPLPKSERIGIILLAAGLAALTYRFVERSGQRWKLFGSRPSVTFGIAALGAGAVIALSFAAGTLPRLNAGRPVAALGPTAPAPSFVPSNLAPPLSRATSDVPAVYPEHCAVGLSGNRSPTAKCFSGDLLSRKTIVIFGDSHAAQWYPAILALARAHGWRVLTLTKASCPSVDAVVYSSLLVRPYVECQQWRNFALAQIAAAHPFAVVISNSSDYHLVGVSGADAGAAWNQALERTIRLMPKGARTVVIADTPRFDVSPPVCLSEHIHDTAACARPASEALDPPHTVVERFGARAAGAGWIDLDPVICPRGECAPIHGNLLVYRDTNHLAATFVRALTSRLAARLLPQISARSAAR
jgi:hypothetical protein